MLRFIHKIIVVTAFAVIGICRSSAAGDGFLVPPPLKPHSKIAIVTPASAVKDAVIDTAVVKLIQRGYEPVVFPHAYGKEYGSYTASDQKRAQDLMDAFADPEIDAILCTRGGYGTVRLLPMLNADVVRANPKWLIGYSDISDLHAFMTHAGVASIHGPMAGHLATEPDTIAATEHLFEILANGLPIEYSVPTHDYSKRGQATGTLVGGNLLTINGLAETPYDVMNPADSSDVILFIEDVGEKIYAIERVLMRMHLDGSLSRLKGLIIGQFTEYSPSDDFETMEDMIFYWLDKWGYYNPHNPMPIAFGFPTGHVSENFPMVCGAKATLVVDAANTSLKLE